MSRMRTENCEGLTTSEKAMIELKFRKNDVFLEDKYLTAVILCSFGEGYSCNIK